MNILIFPGKPVITGVHFKLAQQERLQNMGYTLKRFRSKHCVGQAYYNITPRCGLFHFSLECYKPACRQARYYGALHRYELCFKLQRSDNICSSTVNMYAKGAAHRDNKNACGEMI
ncbi:MAG: hypothetical protein QM763_17505 [Agriterribacter sp.]